MCLQGEYRVTPGSLQFLHTEQHVYLKSGILLATFFHINVLFKSHHLAGQ